MIRRPYSILIFTIAFLTFGAVSSMSQVTVTSGMVEMEKDDKTRVPVVGALIEIYRTDSKGGFPSRKTDKRGEFTIAGLQPGGIFTFSVSAPGASPTIFPNVRAGQEKLLIIMRPGDGAKWTEEEVRKALADAKAGVVNSGGGELTADQKKQQAEYEAKKKELEEKKAKAEKAFEVVNRMLKEGNAAYDAKNYDIAIAKYTEGFDADPEFVGSAPLMLNNRATAIRMKSIDAFNAAVKNPDVTARFETLKKVKADLAEAVTLFNKSFTMIKNADPADLKDPNIETFRKGAIQGFFDTAKIIVQTEQVGDGVTDIAVVLIPEYINTQIEAPKKNEGMVLLGDMYRVGLQQDKAVEIYKKVLETAPDNLEALNGAGFSLVNLGYIDVENAKNPPNKELADEGKRKLQEGSNFLQKFASLAPDNNKYKADAVALIDTLKKDQNVTPQKVPSTKKKN